MKDAEFSDNLLLPSDPSEDVAVEAALETFKAAAAAFNAASSATAKARSSYDPTGQGKVAS